MGSSYTAFRGHGFWARDGLLETWLETLADAVPAGASDWLRAAGAHWRLQARVGFLGCVDAGLDEHVTSPDQVAIVLTLAEQAQQRLAQLAGPTGYIPATWLRGRRVGGQDTWWRDLDLAYVDQIAAAFTALLRGELRTTAATSAVLPRPVPTSPFTG